MSSEVCHYYLNMNKERIQSERKNLHEYLEKKAERALQGECTAQKRLSEAEVEMDRNSRVRRNSGVALHQTNQQLESQRLELHQANQWADRAQRENSRLFGESSSKNRLHQEHHARVSRNRRITNDFL